MMNIILRALREERGLTLREVGKATGMHYEYISLFEQMKKFPDKKQLKALEKYYKTDLKEFFKGVKIVMLRNKARKLEEEALCLEYTEPEDLWK